MLKKKINKKRAYIIAEIGINHDGNFKKACKLIEKAKNAVQMLLNLKFFNPKL